MTDAGSKLWLLAGGAEPLPPPPVRITDPDYDAETVCAREWMAEAACMNMDPDIFFPTRGGTTTLAREVCATCPVTEACLNYALMAREDRGVWGGTIKMERRRMVRRIQRGQKSWRLCLECRTVSFRLTGSRCPRCREVAEMDDLGATESRD